MLDRTALRLAYRPLEEEVVGERLKQARLAAGQQGEASAIARTLVKAVRGQQRMFWVDVPAPLTASSVVPPPPIRCWRRGAIPSIR